MGVLAGSGDSKALKLLQLELKLSYTAAEACKAVVVLNQLCINAAG